MSEEASLIGKATEFIAEEMGVALKRSALSPNIRERMDHSCAVLDADGRIVAQAEHIPVHLGSFREGARRVLRWIEEEEVPVDHDDMLVVNDPYLSGTHLNDLMLLAPVSYRGRNAAYVVNKAHIVDVGGPVPGSLNPHARTLHEEGVMVPPTLLVRRSRLETSVVRLLRANFKDPETALGDIQAQVAANRMGIRRVLDLFQRFGPAAVAEGWRESVDRTTRLVRGDLARMPSGTYRASDHLELDTTLIPVRVRLRLSSKKVLADFSGSAPQVEAPLNAVFGVTYSAVAFAVRCALSAAIPTNEGFYRCLEVRAPLGSLVNPIPPAAVSGGNVETTQRVADVVLSALGVALGDQVPAASAGTMMNVMLGGRDATGAFWAYYETIAGGSGGRATGEGVSGVHTNMTNTLNTPIEIAESEYPLFFTAYRLRKGSGGKGSHRGGDGIVRSFRVLAPTSLSVLADRILKGPSGRNGGANGAPARITLLRGGRRFNMSGKFSTELGAGDEVVLETPGGGGFGAPSSSVGPRNPHGGSGEPLGGGERARSRRLVRSRTAQGQR